jgi:hypothetical protein
MDTPDIRLHDPTWRQINKYRAKAAEKAGISTLRLPTGATIITEEVLGKNWRGIRPPGSDKAFALHSPDKYLRDAKPGCRYIWRKRNDETTFGLVESGRVRPVASKRIRRNVKGTQSIYNYAGPPDSDGDMEYAAWGTMALFEASPEAAQEWYVDPELYDLSLLASIKDEDESTNFIAQGIREAGRNYGVNVEQVKVERKDVQSAAREQVRSPGPT